MKWTWFHRWTSAKWFYQRSLQWQPWLWCMAAVCLLIGVIWGLAFAPEDYQQGNSFRIFYVHLPAAILTQSVFLMMAVSGIVLLVWRIKLADVFIRVAAPFGASITLLALATGAIWGKPTWGTWWEWDARLTSTLIQFFLYMAVVAIYYAMETREQSGKAAALVCIVGFVNIPIIKYSVNWWHTLHQPATFTITEKPSMPAEMYLPVLVMLVGFYCFFAALIMYRMNSEIILQERGKQWLQQILNMSGHRH